ncbi:TIGR01777 family oxidoreductase [Hwangdonia lutea]|uniref:TIGR01777 family oxidoreductase n=1 Tax=Hwangdonia lutea TaxID=3075823 RepID=A0AA97HQ38_9FLAO|nr:TIGR01777 family oxidoreductase [Hwangdonia sp. SCSIO 19198]WOD42283.1 TIGR01777 family oxidoreductase [Hwangdonia sp. SCSIO 19198]
MKKIIIAGGTGFLGQVLENYLNTKGYKIKILTRHPKKENDVFWNAKHLGNWINELENADVLINLTGKSVDCRYNEKNKKLIYDSRIDATNILGLAINRCENPPKIWINSSTATIYKHSLYKEMTEDKGEIGNDFSMNIAKSWEEAFYGISNVNTRKIALRTSIVLGKNGGALIPLKKLTKFGLGGKQGHGNQKVSWIHELDFARAVEFLILSKSLKGNFNLSVPKPTDNLMLMKTLRKIMTMPIGIPHPKWLLSFGAKLIGTETELVLKSRNVIPKRLLDSGFTFKYANIKDALQDLIKN